MAKGRSSLSELMGKSGAAAAQHGGLKLEHLPHILGDGMPELPRNAIGRHRLVMALKQRFGDNFRALPGVSGLVSQFDGEIATEEKIAKLKAIKPQRK